MDLPTALVDAVLSQNVVLVLGAGASLSALNEVGQNPPSGSQLKKLLAEKFLGGGHEHDTLAQVAAYAQTQCGLLKLQDYVKSLFEGFKPTDAHLSLGKYRWRGLSTTNYDILVESAYSSSGGLQRLLPRIENGDLVQDALADPDSLLYYKLHGCLTRHQNIQCPLILTTDQYNDYTKNRDRVFSGFKEWAYESTMVFIGHGGQDQNINQTLYSLSIPMEARPRFYMIKPSNSQAEREWWAETKRVSLLDGTFASFMAALGQAINPEVMRLRKILKPGQHSIVGRFTDHHQPSAHSLNYISTHLTYVKTAQPESKVNPVDFYRGHTGDWEAIDAGLDAPRDITDEILEQVFLLEDPRARRKLQVVLLKGYAGSGKSVTLKRIAWIASRDYDCLCLFVKDDSPLDANAMKEIVERSKERVFIFVDNAPDRAAELRSFVRELGDAGELTTLILGARNHEWNSNAGALEGHVTTEFEMASLNEGEIRGLLAMLEKHKALGRLEDKNEEQRLHAFEEKAGRQLLVALHEATMGRRFEDILVDEYESLVPANAQHVYLTICILNRLEIPVRAGLISRIHDIPFTYFSKHLFKPLEHVVYATDDARIRDYVYRARHPVIADIVFDRILTDEKHRFEEYFRTVAALDIDYKTDGIAFSKLLRGRTLIDIFSNEEHIESLYELAEKMAGDDPHLKQQRAIYEMRRPKPNFGRATAFINDALKIQPHAKHFLHTKSEIAMKRADSARSALERDKYLVEATQLARKSRETGTGETRANHTLAKINLMRLKDYIATSGDEVSPTAMQELVRAIESEINSGLQEKPGDSYLLTAQAELARTLNDAPKMISSLDQALKRNPKLGYLAIQLASCYSAAGDSAKAKDTLEFSLAGSRNDKDLNYRYGLALAEIDGNFREAAYHFKLAFSPGDRNYSAQLHYLRASFLAGDYESARQEIEGYANRRWTPFVQNEKHFESPNRFTGRVSALKSSYLFAKEDQSGISVMVPHSAFGGVFPSSIGSRISFRIAFSFRGLRGVDAECI